LEALIDLRSGGYAEQALSRQLERHELRGDDRALATELVYGVLRWRDRLDAIITRLLDRPHRHVNPVLRDILRLSLYQISILERIPVHAAVDQAVIQSRARFGQKVASFVNALLRRFARERHALDTAPEPEAAPGDLAVYYSHPGWLVDRWIAQFGCEATREILAQNNSAAPLVLRVNSLKSAQGEVAAMLAELGASVSTVQGLPDSLMVREIRRAVEGLPGYQEGLFTVQSAASQMIAPLLRVRSDHRVLDACAAPGGKTAHLAAISRNRAPIIAVDANANRLDQTRVNLARLGVLSVDFVHGDATSEEFLSTLGHFDRILVDAPCSNLGVLRHNPDAKYRVEPHDLSALAAQQLRLLQGVSRVLKPGGLLVYAVCTPMEEETRAVIDRFLSEETGFAPLPIDGSEVPSPEYLDERGMLTTFPSTSDHHLDGFFAARISRL